MLKHAAVIGLDTLNIDLMRYIPSFDIFKGYSSLEVLIDPKCDRIVLETEEDRKQYEEAIRGFPIVSQSNGGCLFNVLSALKSSIGKENHLILAGTLGLDENGMLDEFARSYLREAHEAGIIVLANKVPVSAGKGGTGTIEVLISDNPIDKQFKERKFVANRGVSTEIVFDKSYSSYLYKFLADHELILHYTIDSEEKFPIYFYRSDEHRLPLHKANGKVHPKYINFDFVSIDTITRKRDYLEGTRRIAVTNGFASEKHPDVALKFLQIARQNGCETFFSFSNPDVVRHINDLSKKTGTDYFEQIMKNTMIISSNKNEYESVASKNNSKTLKNHPQVSVSLLDSLRNTEVFPPALCVCTMGENGLVLVTKSPLKPDLVEVEADKISPELFADTTGAGDFILSKLVKYTLLTRNITDLNPFMLAQYLREAGTEACKFKGGSVLSVDKEKMFMNRVMKINDEVRLECSNSDEVIECLLKHSKDFSKATMGVVYEVRDDKIMPIASTEEIKLYNDLDISKTVFKEFLEGKEKIQLNDVSQILSDTIAFDHHTNAKAIIAYPVFIDDKLKYIYELTHHTKGKFKSDEAYFLRYICTAKYIDDSLHHDLDERTGLYNDEYMQKRLSTEIEKLKRFKDSATLVMGDIDFFKRVNDNYDHIKGNEVLKEFGKIFHIALRNTDVIARWGGEEFLFWLTNTPKKNAEIPLTRLQEFILANKYLSELRNDAEKRRLQIPLTMTFGYVGFPEDVNDINMSTEDLIKDMIEKADLALLYGKSKLNRNVIVPYDSSLSSQ
ncbi:hypothetical protein DRJ17_02540 [Candidatus Woesearchaeota archaeon]|nr:MAG: hypothetical protein DRJ17_02540 [Candidatus Woesearchaeota archaeon]